MKNANFKKFSSDQLRDKLTKCYKVQDRTGKFQDLQWNIEQELCKRARAAIFREACRCLKNRYSSNQFAAAAQYADAVLNGSDFFAVDVTHEIGCFYTKSGNPVVVYF